LKKNQDNYEDMDQAYSKKFQNLINFNLDI